MKNPLRREPTQAEIKAYNRGARVPARVARAAAQQGSGSRKSLAAQSAAHKKAQRRQGGQS